MDKQRERLVELLIEYDTMRMMRHSIEDCADRLLANGVIVPPCKVGQTVYRIVEMSTGVTKVFKRALCPPYTCETIINCKPTIKRFIRSVVVTKNNFLNVCENFGKTVFLAKEEAEEALKGGVQG